MEGAKPYGANPVGMGVRRIISDLREIQRNISDLEASRAEAEEQASLQIASSAQEFSRRTREVVDDKLTFTAALMRAGEVQAASRLLQEVEENVREEEAALIEVVNEVKVAQDARREKMTRLRLARMLAAAMLGSVLLASSAVGMTLASALSPDEQRPALAPYDGRQRGQAAALRARERLASRVHRLQIGSGYVLLSAPEYRKLARLTGGEQVDIDELTSLIPFLPPALAARVQQALDTTTATVASALSEVDANDQVRLEKSAPKVEQKANEKQTQPSDADESSDPDPAPTGEPEPSPSSNDDDEDRDGDGNQIPEPDDVLLNDGDEG